MPITFNADEVFTLAESIEKNGASFYRKCAQNYPSMKSLLIELAVMEDEHFKLFQSMHQLITSSEFKSFTDDLQQDATAYLAAIAGGYVFDISKDPSETIRGDETPADILRIAIGLEKDSIVYYLGMKDMVPRGTGKEKVESIIREEMRHVKMLGNRLKEIDKA